MNQKRMKLSGLIASEKLDIPQARGGDFFGVGALDSASSTLAHLIEGDEVSYDGLHACAIGKALLVLGEIDGLDSNPQQSNLEEWLDLVISKNEEAFIKVQALFPELNDEITLTDEDKATGVFLKDTSTLFLYIVHLNDDLRLSFTEIAERVRKLGY